MPSEKRVKVRSLSELEKLEAEFEANKKKLQDSCPHPEKSEWIEHWWAPGHSSGFCVKMCKRCGKILEEKGHSEIPLEELPDLALPYEIRDKIWELVNSERMSYEKARKRIFETLPASEKKELSTLEVQNLIWKHHCEAHRPKKRKL